MYLEDNKPPIFNGQNISDQEIIFIRESAKSFNAQHMETSYRSKT